MASRAIAGFRCDVYISIDEAGADGTYYKLGEMRDTTLTVNQEPIDVTSYATNGWLEYIVGLRSWEASTSGLYISSDEGLQRLRLWQLNSSYEYFPYYIFVPKRNQTGASGGVYYKGQASSDSFEINIVYDDAVGASFSMTGSGEVIQVSMPLAAGIPAA